MLALLCLSFGPNGRPQGPWLTVRSVDVRSGVDAGRLSWAPRAGFSEWAGLDSNQRPTDYEPPWGLRPLASVALGGGRAAVRNGPVSGCLRVLCCPPVAQRSLGVVFTERGWLP